MNQEATAKRKTIKKEAVNSSSYEKIFETFQRLFPEFKRSIAKWDKEIYNTTARYINILLKNGCTIRFGCFRNDRNIKWTWTSSLDFSEKTKEKYVITKEVE